jgi:hypothetical protein
MGESDAGEHCGKVCLEICVFTGFALYELSRVEKIIVASRGSQFQCQCQARQSDCIYLSPSPCMHAGANNASYTYVLMADAVRISTFCGKICEQVDGVDIRVREFIPALCECYFLSIGHMWLVMEL